MVWLVGRLQGGVAIVLTQFLQDSDPLVPRKDQISVVMKMEMQRLVKVSKDEDLS